MLTLIINGKSKVGHQLEVTSYDEAMEEAEQYMSQGYSVGILYEDGEYEDI